MFNFLKTMFEMKRLNKEKLHLYVDAGWITESEYRKIVGEEVTV